MDRIIINGGKKLKGNVKISGAKNSALPIIAASIMCEGVTTIQDVPNLDDVYIMKEILEYLGAKVDWQDKNVLCIDTKQLKSIPINYELSGRIRASFVMAGPLAASKGYVKIAMPGGCAIGTRQIDLHIKGLKLLGANVKQTNGYVEISADKLIGNKIYLDFPSVGATENLVMAACLARGETVLENCATEPEIVDMINFLNSCGAKINGGGTDTIKVEGVDKLIGCTHKLIPDRIEAGTFMVMAGATKGDITIENIIPEHIKPIVAKLKECGLGIEEKENSIRVFYDKKLKSMNVKTLPHPGFPTDMQAQFGVLMSMASGTSIITETVFENRFMHVNELNRMNANIKIDGRTAIIEGMDELNGTQVKATDLRAGAALVAAGLAATGTTEISDVYHIDRGYDDLVGKLKSLGADIYKI